MPCPLLLTLTHAYLMNYPISSTLVSSEDLSSVQVISVPSQPAALLLASAFLVHILRGEKLRICWLQGQGGPGRQRGCIYHVSPDSDVQPNLGGPTTVLEIGDSLGNRPYAPLNVPVTCYNLIPRQRALFIAYSTLFDCMHPAAEINARACLSQHQHFWSYRKYMPTF